MGRSQQQVSQQITKTTKSHHSGYIRAIRGTLGWDNLCTRRKNISVSPDAPGNGKEERSFIYWTAASEGQHT